MLEFPNQAIILKATVTLKQIVAFVAMLETARNNSETRECLCFCLINDSKLGCEQFEKPARESRILKVSNWKNQRPSLPSGLPPQVLTTVRFHLDIVAACHCHYFHLFIAKIVLGREFEVVADWVNDGRQIIMLTNSRLNSATGKIKSHQTETGPGSSAHQLLVWVNVSDWN